MCAVTLFECVIMYCGFTIGNIEVDHSCRLKWKVSL